MQLFYTGIGSRETPEHICTKMTAIATQLESIGFILRSGAAQGADTAFEAGVKNSNNKEIYLPWVRFNGSESNLYNISHEAFELASQLHPMYSNLKFAVKKLHARNMYQVLGATLNRSSTFVLCYTKCGSESTSELNPNSGGTATAIKLANIKNIPVFNLRRSNAIERLYSHLLGLSAIKPVVYNKHKDTYDTKTSQYIGRGSPYGNPFVIGSKYTRDNVCDLFETETLPYLDVEHLRGRNLVCYCNPLRCHGHSIFKRLYGTKEPTAALDLPGLDHLATM